MYQQITGSSERSVSVNACVAIWKLIQARMGATDVGGASASSDDDAGDGDGREDSDYEEGGIGRAVVVATTTPTA